MKSGLLNFYKPPHKSSAGAISWLKRLLPRKTKIGHAGTLDPFATGVLVVLIGKATKYSEKMMSLPKQYIANIKLGASTLTDDLESEEIISPVQQVPGMDEIIRVVNVHQGNILQKPPIFSALKVGGMRACDRVRMGETIDLPPRSVHIYGIEIIDYQWPELKIRVDCGRGTYIRALARDIGNQLGVGGYLTALSRTRIGDFSIENAVKIDELTIENIDQFMLPIPDYFQASQPSPAQPQPDPQP